MSPARQFRLARFALLSVVAWLCGVPTVLTFFLLASQLQAGSTHFERGDADGNRAIEISDAITILGYLFFGNPQTLSCAAAADSNGDQEIDLADGVSILGYLFLGGTSPVAPFPACGADPAVPGLGCDAYTGCESGNQPPAAAFTATPGFGAVPLDVTFDASGSTDVDGTIGNYAWDFGDGATSAGKVTTHRFDAEGTRTVTLTVTDDQQASAIATRDIVIGPVNAPSSFALIQKALNAGEIDRETAVVYAALAAYGDPRLPAAFQGLLSEGGEAASWELELGFDALSAEHQALLAPFFLPPSADGSWLEIQESLRPGGGGKIEWQTFTSPKGRVKVWYQKRHPEDHDSAVLIKDHADAIWDDLAGAFGDDHMPPLDGAITDKPNGGDGAFDVYLVYLPGSVEGKNTGYQSMQCPACSYILLDPRGPLRSCRSKADAILSTVAHELMHGVQRTFPGFVTTRKNLWWVEATATWEESHYDKNADCEHTWAFDYFERPNESLDYDPELQVDLRRYEAYLWPFYLELKTGGTAILKSIFEKLAGMSTHKAIDGTIAGGYRERFPEFALYNYNQESFTENYRFDRIKIGARTSEPHNGRVVPSKESPFRFETSVNMGGKGAMDIELSLSIPNLSAVYYQFVFPDPEARWVLLQHELIEPGDPGRLQILYKIEGDPFWHHRDLTAEAEGGSCVVFCRDQKDQRLEKLVIIISNSEWTSAGVKKTLDELVSLSRPILKIRNTGCWRWQGDVTATETIADGDRQSTTTLKSKVTLEHSAEISPGGVNENCELRLFRVVSLETDWSHSGTLGDCSGTGKDHYTYTASNSNEVVLLVTDSREYLASGGWGDATGPSVRYRCPDPLDDYDYNVLRFFWWRANESGGADLPVVKNNGVLDGTMTALEGPGSITWTWKLNPISEP